MENSNFHNAENIQAMILQVSSEYHYIDRISNI